jgi:hypothetical protein
MSETEKWTLEDGRRAERRITETINPTGEGEKVIELHVEDERPLRLQQRIVEKRKPLVYEREIHTIDQSGNIVEKKVESVEPRTPMQLVEHISIGSESVKAQSMQDDCDCHVTKEEMIDTIVTAIKTMREEKSRPMLESQSLSQEIAERVGGIKTATTMDKVMWVVIAGLALGLVYVVFGM